MYGGHDVQQAVLTLSHESQYCPTASAQRPQRFLPHQSILHAQILNNVEDWALWSQQQSSMDVRADCTVTKACNVCSTIYPIAVSTDSTSFTYHESTHMQPFLKQASTGRSVVSNLSCLPTAAAAEAVSP
jgi:hypothetical protein